MAAPKKTSATVNKVTIGCKLPNGFILQVGEVTHRINGFNQSTVIGGHGITENVPSELWDAWVEENKERDLYKNGFVFAHDKAKSTAAEAKEKQATQSGTEPLDPNAKGDVEKLTQD
ncbi:hypothetical protein [Acinetobacter stercoris]|uniref:Uncharacterized protein n=1 Tax=Acinetobacter stercoris TaxID=2126983 RepID=A0A2U3MZK8_9GAMM|nr:hypothetical protein [Acinetobacter stercoris]SPL70857.1 hypothetical protein KPC_2035 [Acinetobacter stercoris]